MNNDDYFIKVKNLANVFTSIRDPINYEDLVDVTLNFKVLENTIANFEL
jgi:hypothetical protein